MDRASRRLLMPLLAAALLGFSIFGVLVYREVTVEQADPQAAFQRFAATRSAVGGDGPLLTLDDAGNVVRRVEPPATAQGSPARLGVLAYQASEQRLVTADMPFWFFKLKGPAAQYVVRGTGLDLERLHVTAADLERYGPRVVIDHVRSNGDRLLVWTE